MLPLFLRVSDNERYVIQVIFGHCFITGIVSVDKQDFYHLIYVIKSYYQLFAMKWKNLIVTCGLRLLYTSLYCYNIDHQQECSLDIGKKNKNRF